MEHQRPQLSLVELRQLRWFLGGVIGILSAWTVFYMEVDALITLVFLTATVPFFTLSPRLARSLPAVFHMLAFPIIVAIFAFDLWSTREPLQAMIRLDLMLLCYRCVAPRNRREDLQLILLALFLVVVTGVYTVSIAFVAQILLFTAASLSLLLIVTLSDAREESASKKKDGAPGPAPDEGWENVHWFELAARLRQVADLRVIGLGAGLFACLVVLSGVLFLALPRFDISNDFFFDRLITKSTRTGFSENVTFQDVVDIQKDNSVAAMIDVSDPSEVPAEPYWRMLVLDEYSGEGFRMSPGLRATLHASREKTHVHAGRGRTWDNKTVWIVYFQPGVSKYLPLMGTFSRITFGEPQALAQSFALRIAMLPIEPAKMVAYRIEGMDTSGIIHDRQFAREEVLRIRQPGYDIGGFHDRMPEPDFEENPVNEVTFRELGLAREEDFAQLQAWVEEFGGAGEGGADFARRAGAWLQNRHSYSLSMRLHPGEGDPLVRWIASSEPGHCEMFAGSLVILARAAGVPARLITGFKGGVWNPNSGSITVRNSDAHAWAEIWDRGRRAWIRADATPGSAITPPSSPEPNNGAVRLEYYSGWSARIDSLRIFWYRRIVNFDQGSQLELIRGTKEHIRTALQSLRTGLEEAMRSFLEWLRSPWSFSRFAALGFASSALLGGIIFWRRVGHVWWLAWRSRRAASHRRDPVRIEASRWLARLDRAEKSAGGIHSPELGKKTAEARARLLRLRFGAREGWASPAVVFREAKQTMRALARQKRQPAQR